MADWQPIETAPKDGAKIIVYTEQDGFVPWVYWDAGFQSGTWMSEFIRWSGLPTHWMPLPEPPNE